MVLLGNQSLNFSYSMWLAQPITECDWLNQSLNFSYSMWLAEPVTEFLLFHVTSSTNHWMWLAQPITEFLLFHVTSSTNHWMWLAQPITEFLLFHVTSSTNHWMWLAQPITEFLLFHVTCWTNHWISLIPCDLLSQSQILFSLTDTNVWLIFVVLQRHLNVFKSAWGRPWVGKCKADSYFWVPAPKLAKQHSLTSCDHNFLCIIAYKVITIYIHDALCVILIFQQV